MVARRLAAGLTLALALAHPGPVGAATIKTVALRTGVSPIAGFPFSRFKEPVIGDAAGQRVAVYNRTRGGERCIFKLDPDGGADAVPACEKDVAPGGAAFSRLGEPTINAANEAAWASSLTLNRSGVFREGPGPGPQLVASTGDPVPAPGIGLLQTMSLARITATGDVVLASTISGGAVVLGVEVNNGIFRCTGGDGNCSTVNGGTGTLQTLVLVNDPVPDRPLRELCTFYTHAASTFGIVFRATTKLDCADTLETALAGIFRMPFGGVIATVAFEGEPSEPNPAPGGTIYQAPGDGVAINDSGFVAFPASTSGLSSTGQLYLCNPATCPVAPAESAVGVGDADDAGNVFVILRGVALSNAGDIAFSAGLSLPSRSGTYIRRLVGDDIETIAVKNDAIPDLAGGIFLRFAAPSMSAAGKVAFRAKIKWPVSRASRYGIFAFE